MSQQHLGLIFWNVRESHATIPLLGELVNKLALDVVALAESPLSSGSLALSLSKESGRSFHSDPIETSGRIVWAFRNSVKSRPVFDGERISIREVFPPLGPSVLIAAIHAPSRMARDLEELNVLMPRLSGDVTDSEAKVGHDRTIVAGDFNLSPFDKGMISSESFHATMAKDVAMRGARVVYGNTKKFFFNPMWKLMASDEKVCGTLHYSSNNPLEYFWHCPDQILVRPAMLPHVMPDSFSIVKAAGAIPLVDNNGRPSISDHLPISAITYIV